jgi:hypothetical protein
MGAAVGPIPGVNGAPRRIQDFVGGLNRDVP